jgi:hypothetical protein
MTHFTFRHCGGGVPTDHLLARLVLFCRPEHGYQGMVRHRCGMSFYAPLSTAGTVLVWEVDKYVKLLTGASPALVGGE